MAEYLGVSPLTLRQSLAVLRSKGLLGTRRGRGGGSYVAGLLPVREAEIAQQLRRHKSDDLRDVIDLAAATAGSAARLASRRSDEQDVGQRVAGRRADLRRGTRALLDAVEQGDPGAAKNTAIAHFEREGALIIRPGSWAEAGAGIRRPGSPGPRHHGHPRGPGHIVHQTRVPQTRRRGHRHAAGGTGGQRTAPGCRSPRGCSPTPTLAPVVKPGGRKTRVHPAQSESRVDQLLRLHGNDRYERPLASGRSGLMAPT